LRRHIDAVLHGAPPAGLDRQPSLASSAASRPRHGAAFGIRGGDCDCRMLRILDPSRLVVWSAAANDGSGFLLFLCNPGRPGAGYSAIYELHAALDPI